MTINRIILLYKRSAYSIYFKRSASSFHKNANITNNEIERFRKVHDAHHESLRVVEQIIQKLNIPYLKVRRGQKIHAKKNDLIVTVGGDGTFLEAASGLTDQVLIGVNSDPSWSVGRFCCATSNTFGDILAGLLNNTQKISQYHRLELRLSEKRWNILNDVLFAHANPAAMSRYCLNVGGKREVQKSSGVWISTAAGSSGAIKSAGGKQLLSTQKVMQYKPRELYVSKDTKYQLTGEVLTKGSIKVTSMMREGFVFLDGSHFALPVAFGESVEIGISKCPLNVICNQ